MLTALYTVLYKPKGKRKKKIGYRENNVKRHANKISINHGNASLVACFSAFLSRQNINQNNCFLRLLVKPGKET